MVMNECYGHMIRDTLRRVKRPVQTMRGEKSMRVQDMVATSTGNMSSSTDPLLYTVDEASAKLRLHRSRLYPLMASGSLAYVKIGKSRRIPHEALTAFITRLLREQSR